MAVKTATKVFRRQRLGPRQLAWVKALESGKYQQCRATLFNGEGYCCLGLACRVKGMRPRKCSYTGSYLFGKESCGLPSAATKHFAFRTDGGKIDREKMPTSLRRAVPVAGLIRLNDAHGWSFKRIAAFIRKCPQAVFSKPR